MFWCTCSVYRKATVQTVDERSEMSPLGCCEFSAGNGRWRCCPEKGSCWFMMFFCLFFCVECEIVLCAPLYQPLYLLSGDRPSLLVISPTTVVSSANCKCVAYVLVLWDGRQSCVYRGVYSLVGSLCWVLQYRRDVGPSWLTVAVCQEILTPKADVELYTQVGPLGQQSAG